MSEANIQIKNFDGPLDLLLSLIKDKKVDIFDVDISELASQYLKIIEHLKESNFDLAADYLVMASTLLQLKTKILLEIPENKKEIEEETKDILKQLVEYQQYKEVAKKLREQEFKRAEILVTKKSDTEPFVAEEDESKLHGKSDAIKLIMQLRKLFERTHAEKLRKSKISTFNLSPAERRLELLELLKDNDNPTFEQIFNVPTLNHFAVTMLTILDMSRKQELIIEQDEQFGTIKFKKGEING